MKVERFRPLTREEMTPEQARIVDDILSSPRKSFTGPFHALLRSPGLAAPVHRLGEYVRFHSAIPSRLNEFAILITARRWTSQFEWYAHEQLAREAGLDRRIIGELAEGRRPSRMQRDEEIVHDFCIELLDTGTVDGTLADAVAEAFGDRGLVDLIGVVGFYCLVSMVLNVGNFPVPDGVEPPLKPLERDQP